jgi:hypothetical protein
MGRRANVRHRMRSWTLGAVLTLAVALAATGGGAAVAKALNDRTGGNARPARPTTTTSPSTGVTPALAGATKPAGNGHKPPRTTTTLQSTTTTTSPETTTTAPRSGLDVKIPLTGFGDMLVDEARGRVYISGGKGTNSVVVTDLDGNIQQTVGIGRGGGGMTLSPDGAKLDVALVDSDGIAIIDLATYAVDWYYVGTHDGVPTCPRDVAWAAGQLWFGWGCDNAPAGIGRVDPETRDYTLGAYQADSRIATAPLLATVPSQPDMLIAGETGTNPALLFRFKITTNQSGQPELDQQVMRWTDGGSVRQLAVTPDGGEVIVPSGAPYDHQALRTSDLTLAHTYPTTAYPNAAAIRSDGLVAAGSNAAYDTDVFVFQPDGSTPIATFEFGHLPNEYTWAHTLMDGGLAWSGNRIYAITQVGSEPDNVTLRIRTVDAASAS